MTKLIFFYLLIINALGFLLMLADKQKARKNLWRIPEATLFTAAFFGGTIGCLAGMYTVRHKTKHLKFILGMPAILIAQIALAVWLLTL